MKVYSGIDNLPTGRASDGIMTKRELLDIISKGLG